MIKIPILVIIFFSERKSGLELTAIFKKPALMFNSHLYAVPILIIIVFSERESGLEIITISSKTFSCIPFIPLSVQDA